MPTPQPDTLPASDIAPSAVVAAWVRDDAYRDRAVRMGFIDRPVWARFLGPLWMGAGIALVFSPWGLLGSLYGGEPILAHVPLLVFAAVLLALGGAQTFHAMWQATARRYTFVGDTARWELSDAGLVYRVATPDGSVRHESRSQWGWFRAMHVDATGLRLYRVGTAESYFIPATGFVVQPGQSAQRALQTVAGWARGAGVPLRTVSAWDLAGVLGTGVTTALLVLFTLAHAVIVATPPQLRWGRVSALFVSGVEAFWWVACLCAVTVVALHGLLAAWQHRRAPARTLPAQAPHLVLALVWGGLLLVTLQALRRPIFNAALPGISFAGPFTVMCTAVLVLLTGFVLHRGFATPWAARRVALHNDGSGTSP